MRCSSGSDRSGCTACPNCRTPAATFAPDAAASGGWPTTCRPRPGSTCSADRHDEVLYVGTSGNLHQRVRSYFSAAETRNRIKHMVTLAERVDHVECAHALEAHIREQRLIAIHQPPYNRRSRKPGRVCWVTLTDEAFPAAEHRAGQPGPDRRLPRSVHLPAGRPDSGRGAAGRGADPALHRADPPARSRRKSLRAGRTRPVRRALRRGGGRGLRRPRRPDRRTGRRRFRRGPGRCCATG